MKLILALLLLGVCALYVDAGGSCCHNWLPWEKHGDCYKCYQVWKRRCSHYAQCSDAETTKKEICCDHCSKWSKYKLYKKCDCSTGEKAVWKSVCLDCPNDCYKTKYKPCKYGKWSKWGPWSECKDCKKYRVKECRKRKNQCDCKGYPPKDYMDCYDKPSYWGQWGPWKGCEDKCKGGSKKRYRVCHKVCGKPCYGKDYEEMDCPPPPMSYWSQWGPWSGCDPCKGGKEYRERTCHKYCYKDCPGYSKEYRDCPKPPESYWGQWGPWEKCPCGGGIIKRYRTCNKKCYKDCYGSNYETKKCDNPYNPCECKWKYSECKYPTYCRKCTCGKRTRTWYCTKAEYCPKDCPYAKTETVNCCDY